MLSVRHGILGAVLALAASHAEAAQAATYSVVGTGGTLHVHPAPSLSSPTVGNLRDGTRINIVCQTRGSLVRRSTMWDKIDRPLARIVHDAAAAPVVGAA